MGYQTSPYYELLGKIKSSLTAPILSVKWSLRQRSESAHEKYGLIGLCGKDQMRSYCLGWQNAHLRGRYWRGCRQQ